MSSKKFPLLNTIKYLLFLGIGILLLYLAFRGKDLNSLLNDLTHANYYWVALSLLFGAAAYIVRGVRWLILLEPMGYHPKLSNSIHAVIVSYFANLAVPRIGEITRCTVLNQVEKIPVDKLFGTVILERVIDFVILLCITLVTILLNIDLFGNFFFDLFGAKASAGSSGSSTLPVIGGALILVVALLYFSRKKLAQFTFLKKVNAFLLGIKDGFITILKLKQKRLFFFYTALIWIFYYLMAYVCFFSIEATSHLSAIDGLFVLAVGGFGMAAPVQGGIGAYHVIVSLGLGVLSINESDGLLFATIVHTSQTLLTLVAGCYAVLMLYFAKRKFLKLTQDKALPATEA
jgi:LPXTG-motif cell wall-anchored protein